MFVSLLDRRESRDPVAAYLALMAGQAVCHSLFFTVQLVYQVTVVGLDPFQMLMVGMVLEAAWVMFDLPTGVVADVYSRRLSVVVGVALVGGSYALEGGVPAYWAALGGQLLFTLGGTFFSGAAQAWVADEVGDERVGRVLLRGQQMTLVGRLGGTAACVPLALVSIRLPMVAAGAGMVSLAVGLWLVMPERNFRPEAASAGSELRRLIGTARSAVGVAFSRPVPRGLLAISVVTGLAAEAWDRLWTPSLLGRFAFPPVLGVDDPVIWFAANGVVGTLVGLATSELYRRRGDADRHPSPGRLLAWATALDVSALVVFAVAGELWVALAMTWVRVAVWSVGTPVRDAWLNRHLEPATRASVISMTSQANSLGQAVGAPAHGWVATGVSVRAALVASALVAAPTVVMYRRLAGRQDATVEVG